MPAPGAGPVRPVKRGTASAQQVHETLMTLLHSNWAAVTTTDAWATAATDGDRLTKSDLVTSATQGLAAH